MRHRVAGMVLAGVVVVGAGVGSSQAQALAPDPLLAARDEVMAALVTSLPAELPAGALAVLPPEVVDREAVDGAVSATWATAMAEALHRQRPQVVLTDRGHLTEVLREQKFGDSAYADATTATRVGKLVAARTLLLTRLYEFRLRDGRVRVALETSLVDVETGRDLWSRAYHKGIFPFWAKVLIAVVLVVLALLAVLAWRHQRKVALVGTKIPRAKAEARVDVDALVRSVADARERLQRAGVKEGAQAVQRAWVELDAVLERVRHALPGGAVDRSRVRDLAAAVREAEMIGSVVADLRRECDRADTGGAGAEELARRLQRGASALRAAVDAYRKHLL